MSALVLGGGECATRSGGGLKRGTRRQRWSEHACACAPELSVVEAGNMQDAGVAVALIAESR